MIGVAQGDDSAIIDVNIDESPKISRGEHVFSADNRDSGQVLSSNNC